MDVGFSEEQIALRDSARSFLARACPMSRVREQIADAAAFDDALWQQIAELGWLGLLIPESHGGSGLGLVDVAVLLEELGRVLCPAPVVSNAVVAASALGLGGSEAQRAHWLPRLASGERRVALAWLEDGDRWHPDSVHLVAEPMDDGFRLSGRKRFVLDALAADTLLVATRTGPAGPSGDDGLTLCLLDASTPGIERRPVDFNDLTRPRGEVRFDRVEVPRTATIGSPGQAWPILEACLDRARVALCAEQAGAAQRVLEMSVEYARNREQFGQPIGRFQALQHHCADMLIQTEGIRSAAYFAAWSLDHDEPLARTHARLAKAYAADAGLAVAGRGIQIHGGLGFTWEQDLHLYYKRAQSAALEYGGPSELRALAADDLIGPAFSAAAPAPAWR